MKKKKCNRGLNLLICFQCVKFKNNIKLKTLIKYGRSEPTTGILVARKWNGVLCLSGGGRSQSRSGQQTCMVMSWYRREGVATMHNQERTAGSKEQQSLLVSGGTEEGSWLVSRRVRRKEEWKNESQQGKNWGSLNGKRWLKLVTK